MRYIQYVKARVDWKSVQDHQPDPLRDGLHIVFDPCRSTNRVTISGRTGLDCEVMEEIKFVSEFFNESLGQLGQPQVTDEERKFKFETEISARLPSLVVEGFEIIMSRVSSPDSRHD
jgi:hypothetical protein